MNTLSTTNTNTRKKVMSKKLAIASMIALSMSAGAHAGLIIDISEAVAGSSQDYKSSVNNILGSKNGYFGASILTNNALSTNITVEFLGSEATWNSWFTINSGDTSSTIINHPNGSKGVVKANANNLQKGSVAVAANQLLDFTFFIDNPANGNGTDKTVSNSNNGLPKSLNAANSGAYFWTGFEYGQQGNITAILLGLDDSGYLNDEDQDDLVIRITGFDSVTFKTTSTPEVPVPASALLFGTALSALGLTRKKSRKN